MCFSNACPTETFVLASCHHILHKHLGHTGQFYTTQLFPDRQQPYYKLQCCQVLAAGLKSHWMITLPMLYTSFIKHLICHIQVLSNLAQSSTFKSFMFSYPNLMLLHILLDFFSHFIYTFYFLYLVYLLVFHTFFRFIFLFLLLMYFLMTVSHFSYTDL